MGALRNFASHAAYLTTASLSGASVIRTTIQSMSGGGWSAICTDDRDRTMRLFSELGCRRTQDRAGVAPDPDGADADHLGIAGRLHEYRAGRTTWGFGLDLDRAFRRPQPRIGLPEAMSRHVRDRARSRPGMDAST